MTMAVRKVTISVESKLLDSVDRLASRAGQSRSEWLAAAAEQTIRQDKLRRAIARALAESGGPLTTAERVQAMRDLGLSGPDVA
jgi:predicted transcriptional regulator